MISNGASYLPRGVPKVQAMQGIHRFVAVSLVLILGACAGQPVPKKSQPPAQAAAAPSNAEQIGALYERLDADVKRFTTARAAAGNGSNAAQASAETRAALDDLQAASAQCLEI